MNKIQAWGAPAAGKPLAPMTIERRDPRAHDVVLEILYCGVCHSDVHQARDEWGGGIFPMVPGHEIIGRVVRVGAEVTKLKVGDIAGVGCLVDSCRGCAQCKDGFEQYCENGWSGTYNGMEQDKTTPTYGGYSTSIVVDEAFTLRVPSNLDPAAAAPLLCAGITTYSPLRQAGCKPGDRVGVVGLGGLGHMAVKLAHAMGAHVVLFTTSKGKVADAKRLGADEVVLSNDAEAMKAHAGSFHFILDTVAASHDLDAYTTLLARDGTLCLVGAPEHPHPSPLVFNLIFGRKSIAGSLIGGIRETQEMLDFCAEKGLTADIETIPVQKVNEAYERMLKGDVKYRFVIDMASLK